MGIGDFTGDSKSDVMFLCCSDYASLWRSQGTASFAVSVFQPWPQYGMTSGRWQLGYFNNDNKLDMIHLCCSDQAQVWLSNGDGTFSIRAFQPSPGYGMQSGSWLVGDFNGDLRTDLVHLWTNGNYANVWLSNGDGSFSIRSFAPWPDYGFLVGSWQSGDFNADGRLDLMHLWGGDVNIWLSNGDGSFSIRSFAPWPGYGYNSGSWQAGDFNGDRRTDLIHFWGGSPANIWLSNGDGNFSILPFEPWPGYNYLSGVWLPGDFNGDGRTDFVHIWGGGYANVWLSKGDAGFSLNLFSPWPGYGFLSGSWHVGDFDGDGRTDLFHLCCHYVNIWRSNGDGSFTVARFTP
jgi:hypothetical protein